MSASGNGPARHEVWPVRFIPGLYHVRAVRAGLVFGVVSHAAVVWGRHRAIERARSLQHAVDHPPDPRGPVFRTDRDPLESR